MGLYQWTDSESLDYTFCTQVWLGPETYNLSNLARLWISYPALMVYVMVQNSKPMYKMQRHLASCLYCFSNKNLGFPSENFTFLYR